eukprot:jgi/Tetstr1/444517/TSEL_032396.t1
MGSNVAIIGAGPAGLGLALALARRGTSRTITVYDLAEDHATAPRYNPDRSYTIDITGHGARTLEYLDVASRFNRELIKFAGIRGVCLGKDEPWVGPGWTGSRGDICRTLMAEIKEKHPGKVNFLFETEAHVTDIDGGRLVARTKAGKDEVEARYDLIVACDGAGSMARRAMADQVPEFTVEKAHVNNYCTMIHFDQNTEDLDPQWLYVFNLDPLVVGGAISGDGGPSDPKWFCQVGFSHNKTFADAAEAKAVLHKAVPAILRYVSDSEVAAFSKRSCAHIGRAATCNMLSAGRLVLVGDAGGPFPPVGQGINAALEASMVLDQCLAQAESEGKDVRDAAAAYTKAWLPEAHGVSWIAQRVEFGNPWKMGLVLAAVLGGFSVLNDAKKGDRKWSELARRAQARQAVLINSGYLLLGAAGATAAAMLYLKLRKQ